MLQETLYFIQPHVLERLVSGQFVARRQQSVAYRLKDRRNMLSPLNVVRRAIRYEPRVFANRRTFLIDTARQLNQPETKLVLVSGPFGRGKTAFIRGLAEMMGGGKEQLLWFDVSRHTDADEIVRFLVEYMTYICRTANPEAASKEAGNPIITLEQQLQQAADSPILIVIDNMEHLVGPEQTLRSRELKEAFNFLLAFPNVKLVLSGKHLPLADMNPSASAVTHLVLPPLSPEQSQVLIADICRDTALKAVDFSPLFPYLQGEPYRLFLFAALFERHPHLNDWGDAFEEIPHHPERVFWRFLEPHLSETERQVLPILALIRHGVSSSGLQAMVTQCNPALPGFDFQHAGHSLIRLLLKKVYPPQLVLDKLHRRLTQQQEADSIEPYYQLAELFQELLRQQLSDSEANRYHGCLQQFYTAERGKHVLQRLYTARTRHLVAEAQYHLSQMKKRRFMPLSPLYAEDISIAEPLPNSYAEKVPLPLSAETEDERELLPFDLDQPAEPFPLALPDSDFSTVPVALHINTRDVLPSTVHLSEADLEKLARLIAHNEEAPQPLVSPHLATDPPPPEPRFPMNPIAAQPDTSPPSVDAEEHAIQTRMNEAILHHQRDRIALELYRLARHRLGKSSARNAESCLEKALEFAQEVGVVPLQARIQATLGHLSHEQFRHNKALRHLREVEHLLTSAPVTEREKPILATAYRDMGNIFAYRQQYDDALAVYRKGLALTATNTRLRADLLFQIALTTDDAGQPDAALREYQAALDLATILPANDIVPMALYNLASLYIEQSCLEKAEEALRRCLIYDKQSGSHHHVFRTLMRLSGVHEERHQWDAAQQTANDAYQVAREAANNTDIAAACLRLGHLAQHAEAWEDAARHYREAQTIGAAVLSTESLQRIHHTLQALQEHLS